jgi:predicted aconitase with swiveling domain
MIIVGSVLAQECYQMTIPVLDQLDPDPFDTVKSGDIVRVDGKAGTLEIVKSK